MTPPHRPRLRPPHRGLARGRSRPRAPRGPADRRERASIDPTAAGPAPAVEDPAHEQARPDRGHHPAPRRARRGGRRRRFTAQHDHPDAGPDGAGRGRSQHVARPSPARTTSPRRDEVCKAASALAEPVKARYQPLYDDEATAAQKADAIAARARLRHPGQPVHRRACGARRPSGAGRGACGKRRQLPGHSHPHPRSRSRSTTRARPRRPSPWTWPRTGSPQQMDAFERRHGLTPCP